MANREIEKIRIDIDETGTTITEYAGGAETTRSVNPDDLRTIFSKVAFDTREMLGGLIPVSGTGIIFAGRKADTEAVIWQADARKADIYFGDEFVRNVPFPHLIFAFCLYGSSDKKRRDNRLKDLKVFALPGSWKSEHDNVYKFIGYGNTYDNGGVCWGSNRLFVSDITDMRGTVNAFYSTPFNTHVGGRLELVKEYAETGQFLLQPGHRLPKTINDVVNETYKGQTY